MEKVQAAGVNRIFYWNENADSGTISAFRAYDSKIIQSLGLDQFQEQMEIDPSSLEPFRVQKRVNLLNSKLLSMKLRQAGYGVIRIDGVYKEAGTNVEQKEQSYFVFDYKHKGGLKEALLKFGNMFAQDSITYADAGADYNLYETTPFSREPNRPLKQASGRVDMSFKGKSGSLRESLDEDQFYSKIRGRPFYWKNYDATSVEAEVKEFSHSWYTNGQAKAAFAHAVAVSRPYTNGDNFESEDIVNIQDMFMPYGI